MESKMDKGVGLGTVIVGNIITALVVLKLVGKIDWSWWVIFSPLWIAFASTVLIVFIFLCISNYKNKRF